MNPNFKPYRTGMMTVLERYPCGKGNGKSKGRMFVYYHSARFMEGHPYEEKNLAILKMMEDKENRKAAFYTAMVFIDKKRNIEKTFFGKNEGEITKEMDYHPISGFGYDPIFFSYDLNKTFGQATLIEKDSISHRGKALMSFLEYYKNEYEK